MATKRRSARVARPGSVRGRAWAGVLAAVLLLAPMAAVPLTAQQPESSAPQRPALRGAESPEARAEAQKAISDLRSPYCPGLMLEVCPSPQAEALRDSIHDLAAEGLDARALVDWMIARHGEEWRGTPLRSGAGLFAWLGPPAGLVLAGLVFFAMLRRMRGRRAAGAAAAGAAVPAGLSTAEQAELTAALREFEAQPEEV